LFLNLSKTLANVSRQMCLLCETAISFGLGVPLAGRY